MSGAYHKAFLEQMTASYLFQVKNRSLALEDLEYMRGLAHPVGPALWYSKAEGWVFL